MSKSHESLKPSPSAISSKKPTRFPSLDTLISLPMVPCLYSCSVSYYSLPGIIIICVSLFLPSGTGNWFRLGIWVLYLWTLHALLILLGEQEWEVTLFSPRLEKCTLYFPIHIHFLIWPNRNGPKTFSFLNCQVKFSVSSVWDDLPLIMQLFVWQLFVEVLLNAKGWAGAWRCSVREARTCFYSRSYRLQKL